MATVKIDRQPAVSQPKVVEQTTAPAPAAKVEEVKSTEPESLFGPRSKHEVVTGPDGKVVSKSADAGELYLDKSFKSPKPSLEAIRLKNLTPEQAQTKMAELKTTKAELETKIEGRAQELDHKWSHMRLCRRAEILRDYMGDAKNSMPPAVKASLDAALEKQKAVQGKIDDLAAQAKHDDSPKGSDDRKALANQLRAARRESSAAVKEATSTVDDAGLHIERLVMTEAKIDPTMGQNSKFGNMGALVGQYFETRFMMDTLTLLPAVALTKEMDREQKEAAKRAAIEDHWRERDDMMRDMLKELSAKDVNQKRDLNNRVVKASRSGDVAKMSSTDIAKLERKRS
jgi:hypothetical protein